MRSLGSIILAIAMLMAMSGVAQAHEAHRKNMSDEEMALLKAGAQPEQKTDSSAVLQQANADKPSEAPSTHQPSFSIVDFLGRLHPAIVHFPIALFLVAGLAEALLAFRLSTGLETTVRFLVYCGAITGVIAASLGWLAGGMRMSDRSELLGLHRWTGTAIAATGILTAILVAKGKNRVMFRAALLLLVISIPVQSYWGAEMSLDPDHLGLNPDTAS